MNISADKVEAKGCKCKKWFDSVILFIVDDERK